MLLRPFKPAELLLYVLVFLVTTYFFVVGLFPAREVSGMLMKRAEKAWPGYRMIAGKAGLGMDLTLTLQPLSIAHVKGEREVLRFKELRLLPYCGAYISMSPGARFEGELNKGQFMGRVKLKDLSGKGGFWSQAHIKGVDLSEIGLLEMAIGYPLRGIAGGTLELWGNATGSKGLSGNLELSIKDLIIPLKNQAIGIPDIIFESASLKGVMDAGNLRIESIQAKSKELNVDITGKIEIKDEFMSSSADLDAALLITPRFLDKIPKNSPIRGLIEKKLKASNKILVKITGTLKGLNWRIK